MVGNEAFGKCGDEVTHFSVLKLVPGARKGEMKNEKQALLVDDGGTQASHDRFPIELLSPDWIVKHWGDGAYQIQWWVEKDSRWVAHGMGRESVTIRTPKRRGRPPKQMPVMDPPARVASVEPAPVVPASSGSVLPQSFGEMTALLDVMGRREAAAQDRVLGTINAVLGQRQQQPTTEQVAAAIREAVAAATAPLVAELAAVKAEMAEWEEDDDEDDDDEEEVELPRNVKHGVQIAAKQALKEVPTVSQVADIAKEGLSVARAAVDKWKGGGGGESTSSEP